MTADTIATAITSGAMFALGAALGWYNCRRRLKCIINGREVAIENLRERLSTVTGQLADERARHAMRINRAHEGACKAAKTRKAMRIKLPEVVT